MEPRALRRLGRQQQPPRHRNPHTTISPVVCAACPNGRSVMVAVFEQGADLSNTTLLKQIIPIIANTEALEVNQAW